MTRSKPHTIIISSAGRRVSLLQAFKDSAHTLGIPLKIIAIDMAPELSSACHIADIAIKVPPINASSYANSLNNIVHKYNPLLIIPTIDPELQYYTSSQLPCPGASEKLTAIFHDKLKTIQFLQENNLPCPKTKLYPAEMNFPYFMKPQYGSASKGVFTAETPEHKPHSQIPYVSQELLQGNEYTVNLYFNKAGTCKCVIPHLRQEVRTGEVSKALTINDNELENLGWQLANTLKGNVWGPLCFQTKKNNLGQYSIFEINPRFGGGYPLTHKAGAKFTQWLLEETLNLPPSANNNWINNIQMLRHDQEVFTSLKNNLVDAR